MNEFDSLGKSMQENELDNVVGGMVQIHRVAPKQGFIIYQVKAGDTVNSIASQFKCTVRDILSWNPGISAAASIPAGSSLYIRA